MIRRKYIKTLIEKKGDTVSEDVSKTRDTGQGREVGKGHKARGNEGAERGAKPLVSNQTDSLMVNRLPTKDQGTPIRVEFLAVDEIVFCQDMTLRDFLAGLRSMSMMAGRHATLFLCLTSGQVVHEGQRQGCSVLFCNGKRMRSHPEEQVFPIPEVEQEASPTHEAGLVETSPWAGDLPFL
ncbi:hypothetical protein E2C01_014381 [Portunus trituberculatus]|uniref:Uncharacterized protein n=1 Tax=Portunus trituberculatus TaxID=210409 RepID=A0A5B7DKB3_PORTR|nr:hypothetical protein [Portunus trituberculatus]